MSSATTPRTRDRVGYYVSTGFLTATMLFSAGMYIFVHDKAIEDFTKLGYPAYLVYPLAIAKLLGVVAVWTRVSSLLKGLAYAGFFFNFILALAAHWMADDGDYLPAVLALLFLTTSYIYERRWFGSS